MFPHWWISFFQREKLHHMKNICLLHILSHPKGQGKLEQVGRVKPGLEVPSKRREQKSEVATGLTNVRGEELVGKHQNET